MYRLVVWMRARMIDEVGCRTYPSPKLDEDLLILEI